jgi:hypothetical protein
MLYVARRAWVRPHASALAVAVLLLASVTLAGCRRSPSIAPTPAPVTIATLPDRQATALIKPDAGGVVALSSGAEVNIPPDAVTDKALVSFHVSDKPPEAPIPRSMIGPAFDFSLDGADLTGVSLITLPLPANLNADQYDLAPYRWNGRAWERMSGRISERGVRFGTDKAGTFALLGQWRGGDATAIVTVHSVEAGRQTIPVQVAGEYRYSSLPSMQHDYTEASLRLKRDISGGAGQINGNESLDQTVAETVLWFKPDPAQSTGLINYSYTFEISPQQLDVPLGGTAECSLARLPERRNPVCPPCRGDEAVIGRSPRPGRPGRIQDRAGNGNRRQVLAGQQRGHGAACAAHHGHRDAAPAALGGPGRRGHPDTACRHCLAIGHYACDAYPALTAASAERDADPRRRPRKRHAGAHCDGHAPGLGHHFLGR